MFRESAPSALMANQARSARFLLANRLQQDPREPNLRSTSLLCNKPLGCDQGRSALLSLIAFCQLFAH